MGRLSIRTDYPYVVLDAIASMIILPTLAPRYMYVVYRHTGCCCQPLVGKNQESKKERFYSKYTAKCTVVCYDVIPLRYYFVVLCAVGCRVQERCPDVVVVAVDPVGSILALPDHLNDQDRLCPYKVCVSPPPRISLDVER